MITKEMYVLAKKIVENYEKQQLGIPVAMPRFFKVRRISLNLSMQDVTDKTGISKSTISRIEQGKKAFFDTVMTLDKFYFDNEA
jgi:DNA-binding Xre family transcriptional regulator